MSEDFYKPELGIKYPDKPDGRMLEVIKTREVIIDKNYPFLDKSFKFKFMHNLQYLGIFTIAFFLNKVKCGLKIEGREILKKHKNLLKNGAMTVSNHVHRWDFLFVLQAVRYRKMYFPAWKEHLCGKDANLIRFAGGIPIPDELSAIKSFNKAFDEIREKKKWIHSFPESTRFDYFWPIRPFKKGVFSMAQKYNLPVIPIAFSYRKSKSKYPKITLRIGEPVLFDNTLSRKEAVLKMRKDCHQAVVKLAGITDNPYPAEGD